LLKGKCAQQEEGRSRLHRQRQPVRVPRPALSIILSLRCFASSTSMFLSSNGLNAVSWRVGLLAMLNSPRRAWAVDCINYRAGN
jgi:hypothetical protein